MTPQITVYGGKYFSSVTFLTTTVAAASLFNGFGRPIWGALADRYGALNVIQVMSAVFSLIILSYNHVSSLKSEALFSIWTYSILFCIGGNFCLYMPISITVSGKKHAMANYGLIFIGLSISELLCIVILAKIKISFEDACFSMGVLCLLGCINLVYLSSRLNGVTSLSEKVGESIRDDCC